MGSPDIRPGQIRGSERMSGLHHIATTSAKTEPTRRDRTTTNGSLPVNTAVRSVDTIGPAKRMVRDQGELSKSFLEGIPTRVRVVCVTTGSYSDSNLFLEGVAGGLIFDKDTVEEALSGYEDRLHAARVKPQDVSSQVMARRKAIEDQVFPAITAPKPVVQKVMDSVRGFVKRFHTESPRF